MWTCRPNVNIYRHLSFNVSAHRWTGSGEQIIYFRKLFSVPYTHSNHLEPFSKYDELLEFQFLYFFCSKFICCFLSFSARSEHKYRQCFICKTLWHIQNTHICIYNRFIVNFDAQSTFMLLIVSFSNIWYSMVFEFSRLKRNNRHRERIFFFYWTILMIHIWKTVLTKLQSISQLNCN